MKGDEYMAVLGLDISSLSAEWDNMDNIRKSFLKMKELGCRQVQMAGLAPSLEGWNIAAALRETGLHCVSYQENFPFAYGKNPEKLVERAVVLGCRYFVFSLLPPEVNTPQKLRNYAESLSDLAQFTMEKGLNFAYRPSRFDFRDMDGQPLYERLIGFLPDKVKLALCIHSTFGQASYAEILGRYERRVELAYFMDSLSLPDGAAKPVPLGEGDHNWQPILRACAKAGVKHILRLRRAGIGVLFPVPEPA